MVSPKFVAKIESEDPTLRLAVLIDADNAQAAVIEGLLAEIAKFGEATVKRIYGDFTAPTSASWKKVLQKHAIKPVQQFAYTTGKNATDSTLIIDAMDLLYTRKFEGFCLVTSDSDFTGLAMRLREEGLTVLGFGEQKTPESLRAACNKFTYVEILLQNKTPDVSVPTTETAPLTPVVKKTSNELANNKKLISLIRSAIEIAQDETGWAQLGGVGSAIEKQATDFDPRNYGYRKLSDLVVATNEFEMVKDNMRVLIREKTK